MFVVCKLEHAMLFMVCNLNVVKCGLVVCSIKTIRSSIKYL